MPLPTIATIEQLKKNLHLGPGYGGYLDLIKAIQLSKDEWRKYCKWEEHKYTRNCISSCDSYELLMMCWKSGQQSPIHNNNLQESWIKVLSGELTVEVFRLDIETNACHLDETVVLAKNEYIYLNDDIGFHRVKNNSKNDSISLHLNIEKVEKWQVFDEKRQHINMVVPKYDTYSPDCIL